MSSHKLRHFLLVASTETAIDKIKKRVKISILSDFKNSIGLINTGKLNCKDLMDRFWQRKTKYVQKIDVCMVTLLQAAAGYKYFSNICLIRQTSEYRKKRCIN